MFQNLEPGTVTGVAITTASIGRPGKSISWSRRTDDTANYVRFAAAFRNLSPAPFAKPLPPTVDKRHLTFLDRLPTKNNKKKNPVPHAPIRRRDNEGKFFFKNQFFFLFIYLAEGERERERVLELSLQKIEQNLRDQ